MNEIIISTSAYVAGIFVTFCIAYWYLEDIGPSIMGAFLWPLMLPLCLIYLPFHGLAMLINKIKEG